STPFLNTDQNWPVSPCVTTATLIGEAAAAKGRPAGQPSAVKPAAASPPVTNNPRRVRGPSSSSRSSWSKNSLLIDPPSLVCVQASSSNSQPSEAVRASPTSSIRTGRRSLLERSAANATDRAARASSSEQALSPPDRTVSTNTLSSSRYACSNRST